jgi:hypothetical protein
MLQVKNFNYSDVRRLTCSGLDPFRQYVYERTGPGSVLITVILGGVDPLKCNTKALTYVSIFFRI